MQKKIAKKEGDEKDEDLEASARRFRELAMSDGQDRHQESEAEANGGAGRRRGKAL